MTSTFIQVQNPINSLWTKIDPRTGTIIGEDIFSFTDAEYIVIGFEESLNDSVYEALRYELYNTVMELSSSRHNHLLTAAKLMGLETNIRTLEKKQKHLQSPLTKA